MSKLTRLEILGKEMRKLRLKHGITLRKMCALFECSTQRLSALEHGIAKGPEEFLPAFCPKDKANDAAKFADAAYKEQSRIWAEMQEIIGEKK